MRTIVILLLGLAACASHGGRAQYEAGLPYPTFESAARASFQGAMDIMDLGAPLQQADRSTIVECLTDSTAEGVPDDAQQKMLRVMNRQERQDSEPAMSQWWYGPGPDAEPRILRNLEAKCPAMLEKYPGLKNPV